MRNFASVLMMCLICTQVAARASNSWVPKEFQLLNIVEPFFLAPGTPAPVIVPPFTEHVRAVVNGVEAPEEARAMRFEGGRLSFVTETAEVIDGSPVTARAAQNDQLWLGTASGLYVRKEAKTIRHAAYGVDGPLATKITGLAVDSKGVLWVGTPLGLSRRDGGGAWEHFQGRDGMPVEDVTTLAMDEQDQLWIGTSRGAILFKPYAVGRQWFYRAGKRYLPGDVVQSIAIAPGGSPVYFLTDGGLGKIDLVTTTLLERAQIIEKRINERHRRFGMVAACVLDNAENPASSEIEDNDNDGLWTAYHVAAMALCYGTTKDPEAKDSARESMHALYMLQNASGVPGLVARSVVPAEIGKAKGPQWRPTPNGAMYWKSDTSSDEIDGHYLAFYTYFEHIAKNDPAERDLIEKQVRALTDHLIEHNYQLIDWDGKRTRWGFWHPEALNGSPAQSIESGLNALQILSFLKVAHHITGDPKYEQHYRKLAVDHHYLNNILLTKRSFPDENNHSDDQLAHVAWYPILQLEQDPRVRRALLAGIRRHYAVVQPEKPSFYIFVYATADPMGADIAAAAENLQEIPTDRRTWAVKNSLRADVEFSALKNRFGRAILTRVLPADERCFEKWNADPYVPDGGGDGRLEDDGAAYLLPYWMGRYHGFIREAE